MASPRYLFIDMSYFVFYRYFAILQWIKRFKPETPVVTAEIMNNKDFMDKYIKTFETSILDIMKQFKISGDNVFFAKDCPRDWIWRRKHYAEYKAGREDKSDTFNKDIFKYTYGTLIPELKSRYGFRILDHDALEADDLIALSVKEVKTQNTDAVVVVVTNDNDYIQLLEHDIILINLQKKMLQERIHEPETYLRRKIIMGDKSDNIPAIMKKCGEKTACKLLADPEALTAVLQDPEVRRQYELNQLLVDFANIPHDLVTAFKALWQERKN